MVHIHGSVNTTTEEARTFATAMAGLAGESGVSKGGYIRETVTASGRNYTYIPPEAAQSTSGKMSASQVVETANRISQFAKNNIVSQNPEKLTGEELKQIQSGVKILKERIESHHISLSAIKKLFLSLFFDVNYKEIADNIKEKNFEGKLLHLVAKATSETIDIAQEREAMVTSFFEDEGSKETIKPSLEKLLMTKFKRENQPIIDKLKGFGVDDAKIENEIKESKAFKKQLNQEVKVHKQQVKEKLLEKLNQLQMSRENLVDNKDVQSWMMKYLQAFEPDSERTCEEIIDELLTPSPSLNEKRASTSIETMEERMTKLDEEEFMPGMIDVENKKFNELRQDYFNELAERSGASEKHKNLRKFSRFIKQFMWNAFVGNKRPQENTSRTRNTSEKSQMSARLEAKREDLDRGNVVANMLYLYNYLADENNDDPNTSKLKDDLERSLPFAFEADFLTSLVEPNEEREKNLSERIYQELSTMQPGQRLFIPVGCKGHATLLCMTKGEDGRVEIQHFNTGFGLEGHQKLVGDSKLKTNEGYPIAVSFEVDLNGKGAKEHIKGGLVRFIQTAHVGESMEGITRGLEDLRKQAGVSGGEIKVSVRRKKTQQEENCSYRCLLEGVRDALGVESYRNFKLGLIKQLKEDYRSNSSVDANDTVMVAGLSATKAGVKEKATTPIVHS